MPSRGGWRQSPGNFNITRGERKMAYKNARDILPRALIEEIQKYIDGDLLYIPTKSDKTEWGIRSGAKQKYAERNHAIREQYRSSVSIEELARLYFLSTDSIKKIVYGSDVPRRKEAQ